MSATEDKAIWLFREQLRAAHGLLEGTVGDMTPEQAHWSPPGTANPLGANYAHYEKEYGQGPGSPPGS